MPPRNPLNDPDVNGNSMMWMADCEREENNESSKQEGLDEY